MTKYKSNQVISGTWGSLDIDGEDVAEVLAFQAKDEFEKEEVKRAGTMSKGYKYVSVDGKGSIKVNHIQSLMIKKRIGVLARQGKTPTFTLTGALSDPDAMGSERCAFTGVVFDDLTYFDYEVGVNGTREIPFTYEDVILLDEI